MGLLDLRMEPHKTILSILFIFSIFLVSKLFVWVFDAIDGKEDGVINIGTCPNIPVLDKFVDYTLNLINLDCNLQGGLTYEDVLALVGENYTIDDALRNRIFRIQVPFMDYFKENPLQINNELLGLKADEVYQLSQNEKVYSVYNDITYYVKTGFLNLVTKKHPIYILYLVKNNETGRLEMLIYDREGWSEKIKEAIDVSGLDPTDVIVFKVEPKVEGSDFENHTINHPFVSSILSKFFYKINQNKIINKQMNYSVYNAETYDVANPQLVSSSLAVSTNKKLSSSLIFNENIISSYMDEVLGVEKLNFFLRKNFDKERITELSKNGLDYLYFVAEIDDLNTGKNIYPSYLEGQIIVIITLSNSSTTKAIITSNQRIDIGTFYPFYNGLYDGQKFYIPIPLRKTKEFIYDTLSNYFNDDFYSDAKVSDVIIDINLYIYPYISTNSNKAIEINYRFETNSSTGELYLSYINNNYFTPSKEDLINIIEGKERIRRKVRKYAICNYFTENYGLMFVLPQVSIATFSVCETLRKTTGSDLAEYFMEAISYYVDANTKVYKIM